MRFILALGVFAIAVATPYLVMVYAPQYGDWFFVGVVLVGLAYYVHKRRKHQTSPR